MSTVQRLVMNADGSCPVAAELTAGVTAPVLPAVSTGPPDRRRLRLARRRPADRARRAALGGVVREPEVVRRDRVRSGRRKAWAELTRTQSRAILVGAAVQLVLQLMTLWDLRRRTADELRGSKRWWTAVAFVNIVGPVAYFVVGRRPPARKRGPR